MTRIGFWDIICRNHVKEQGTFSLNFPTLPFHFLANRVLNLGLVSCGFKSRALELQGLRD